MTAMVSRQRIDWSVLPGADSTTAIWGNAPASPALIGAIAKFAVLFELDSLEDALKETVALAIGPAGLIRAGLYLYDEPADLMLGTWGTALNGEIVDEHHAMFEAGPEGRRVFERALAGEAYWTLVENVPIIDQRGQTTTVVGQGWAACTPVLAGNRRLGMLYNDAGLTGARVDEAAQERAAVLCTLLGAALCARRHSNQFNELPNTTAQHPTLRRAVHMLSRDPSLSGEVLATRLGISLSRLARLFKSGLRMSLVDYRNQIRLERFSALVDGGTRNLLKAALEAGFGSYAQFHRVFRAARGKSPREYYSSRGPTRGKRV